MPVSEISGADRELFAYHVANRLRVSVRTVRWWAKTGRIRAFRRGAKIWKFRLSDVDQLVLRREQEARDAR